MKQVVVYKGRTNTVQVALGFDVSSDSFKSEIREEKSHTSDIIATWQVDFATDGKDGELIITLDDEITAGITKQLGYMDMVRISGGEPLPVFDEPLEVVFRNTITT